MTGKGKWRLLIAVIMCGILLAGCGSSGNTAAEEGGVKRNGTQQDSENDQEMVNTEPPEEDLAERSASDPSETSEETAIELVQNEELEAVIRSVISAEEQRGTIVSAYTERLDTGEAVSVDSGPMQSASLIKLYIAACVYEHLEEMRSLEGYGNETEDLVKSMIAISDNNAANVLVERLGGGNSAEGMKRVNVFCTDHGYTDTSMGRLMLDFSSTADNYTSVRDCGKFLRDVYQNSLAGAGEILQFLLEQERTSKIPAGVPVDVRTANKTGELDHVENDAAIIYAGSGAYVLCVMMNSLQDPAAGRAVITELSAAIYEYMEP